MPTAPTRARSALGALFELMGFSAVSRRRSKNVTLYRQGDVNYVLNAEPVPSHIGPMELNIPAIEGVGGALIYLVDRYGDKGSIWDVDFRWTGERDTKPFGAGLTVIDHLTHNVNRGRMDAVADWYQWIFNFHQIRYFDIEGRFTGLHSRAMTSPCGKIRIPINESADDSSQIEEFLHAYQGEGVQHVACACRDIYAIVAKLRRDGLDFMPKPAESYYDRIDQRLPGHGESVENLRELGILIDGAGRGANQPTSTLLQIFSKTLLGPIFFEFIQRKGDEGFGEGNFRALFETIEEDQLRRGVLQQASE